jgi:uncharacterized protein (TIGR03437 family)
VDGLPYTSVATFNWPIGSQHIITFIENQLPTTISQPPGGTAILAGQLSSDAATIFVLNSWSVPNNSLVPTTSPTQIVTADPGVPSLTMNVTPYYRIAVNIFNGPVPATSPTCTGAPGPVPPGVVLGGLVYVSGQCYWNNAVLYEPANSKLQINAFPYPGFAFLGWSGLTGSSNAFLQNYILTGPIVLEPEFTPAKRVRFETSPLGLQVLIDRTAVPTLTSLAGTSPCPQSESLGIALPPGYMPLCLGDFDFIPGSTHLLGAPTPQLDTSGHNWVFDSWGSGNGQNAVYTANMSTSSSDTVIVKFDPAASVSFVTSPTGLQLTVDGRSNWPAYNFIWGINSTHTVSAPAQQTDAGGRQYTFQGWSNSGPASQTMTVDQTAVSSGFRMIATYSGLSRVVVQSSPAGLNVLVDGNSCTTPCTFNRANGSQMHLTAPASILPAPGVRMDTPTWSDGGAPDHMYTINGDTQTVTVGYNTSYLLAASSDPANGVSFAYNPAMLDGFFPASTQVSITATPLPGFTFRRWSGDLSGTYPSGYLTMSAPHSVVASLNRVPYIAPTGVQNAAGATPSGAVAPGSLISIFGESLAPDTMTGPTNPLAQTIDGVTVMVGNQLLPLVAVAPEQINALLPSSLAVGVYTLVVQPQGQAPVSTTVTVAQDAPGLFANYSNGTAYAAAYHQDGSVITPASPAIQGETVTLLGTGFGSYVSPVIDGFPAPTPGPAVADPVTVAVAGVQVTPTLCTAQPGGTGMVMLQFPITSDMPSATVANLQVQVNGQPSNIVSLPLQ